MDIRIYFKNTEKSQEMENYANQQLSKVVEFLENEPTPVYIGLTFEPSKAREHHRVELLIRSPHYDLVSAYEHTGTDFYDTLDRVIDTMYLQLREAKRKRIDERNHGDPKATVKN